MQCVEAALAARPPMSVHDRADGVLCHLCAMIVRQEHPAACEVPVAAVLLANCTITSGMPAARRSRQLAGNRAVQTRWLRRLRRVAGLLPSRRACTQDAADRHERLLCRQARSRLLL